MMLAAHSDDLKSKADLVADHGTKPKRKISRKRSRFHARKKVLTTSTRDLGVKHQHPSILIQEQLRKRNWTVADIAWNLPREGHRSVVELQLTQYLADAKRDRELLLGPITCAALDHVFGLPNGTLRNIEKKWCEENKRPLA